MAQYNRYIITGLNFNSDYFGYPVVFAIDEIESQRHFMASPIEIFQNKELNRGLSCKDKQYVKQVLQYLGNTDAN